MPELRRFRVTGETLRRRKFIAASGSQPILTTLTSSQHDTVPTRGDPEPRAPLADLATELRLAPPPILDAARPAQQLRPPQALGEPHNDPPFRLR